MPEMARHPPEPAQAPPKPRPACAIPRSVWLRAHGMLLHLTSSHLQRHAASGAALAQRLVGGSIPDQNSYTASAMVQLCSMVHRWNRN